MLQSNNKYDGTLIHSYNAHANSWICMIKLNISKTWQGNHFFHTKHPIAEIPMEMTGFHLLKYAIVQLFPNPVPKGIPTTLHIFQLFLIKHLIQLIRSLVETRRPKICVVSGPPGTGLRNTTCRPSVQHLYFIDSLFAPPPIETVEQRGWGSKTAVVPCHLNIVLFLPF